MTYKHPATPTGWQVVNAADAEVARAAIGAGTSSLVLGTTAGTAKEGTYQPSSADITDSTTVGRSLITSADALAARNAIGSPLSASINVLDYGAKGDWNTSTQTGTDDTAAFVAAIAAAASLKKLLYIPAGKYRLTTPLVIDSIGMIVAGSGNSSTLLYADHLAGPALTIRQRYVQMRDLAVRSSTTRSSASYTALNCGILIDATSELRSLTHTYLCELDVRDQPGHGIAMSGVGMHSLFDRLLAQSNKGHGYVFDGGEIMGRTNDGSPGLVTVRHCWSLYNGGHGLVLGNPNAATTPIRFLFDNFECSANATDASVRYTQDEVWVYGENNEIRRSAIGPLSYDVNVYGIYAAGRGWIIKNNRFVNIGRSVTLSGSTINGTSPAGSTVENCRAFGTQPIGVVVESGVTNARVVLPLTTNMTIPVQDNGSVTSGNVVITSPAVATTSTSLSAIQNDWEWSLGKSAIRLSAPSGGATITGLAFGTTGRQVRLINVGSYNLTLSHQSTLSSANNRIICPTSDNVLVTPDNSALLEYDGGSTRWRVVSQSLNAVSVEGRTIQSISAAFSVPTSSGDQIVFIDDPAGVPTLQTAVGAKCKITIKNRTATGVQIKTNPSNQTIEGAATPYTLPAGQSIDIVANSTNNWSIL